MEGPLRGAAGVLAIGLVLSCIGAVSVPAAIAVEFEAVPAKMETAPLNPMLRGPQTRPDGPFSFTFAISSGYCVGNPRPHVDHVRVVERPNSKRYPYKSVVITAYVFQPATQRVIPPSPPPRGVIYNVCAGLGLSFVHRIKLRRPVQDLVFYDGSYSPPRRLSRQPQR